MDEIDFDALIYVTAPPPSLFCPVCKNVLLEPLQTSCAHRHTLCARCIARALDDKLECPVDRCPMPNGADDCSPVSRLIIQVLDELEVICPNERCGRQLPRGLIQWHMKDECLYQPVPCPAESCDQLVLRCNLSNNECQHTMVKCEHCKKEIFYRLSDVHLNECDELSHQCEHCNDEFSSTELRTHLQNCSQRPCVCEASSLGCQWRGNLEASRQHESSCPINCIRPYFVAQEAKLANLKLENDILKDQMHSLQSQNSDETVVEVSSEYERDRTYIFQTLESVSTGLEHLSTSLSTMDTKQNHMILNESMRNKEEIAMVRGAVQNLRMQWHHFLQNTRGFASSVSDPTASQSVDSESLRHRSPVRQGSDGSRVKL